MEKEEFVPEAQIFVEIDEDGKVRFSKGDEPTEGEEGQADGGSEDSKPEKKEPVLVANRVVHVIPMEQADGSVSHMVISLCMDEEGVPQMLIEKVDPVDRKPGMNMPLNPTEVEGMFLDRDVEDVREIIAAFQAVKIQPETNPKTENQEKEKAHDGEGSRTEERGGSRVDELASESKCLQSFQFGRSKE